MYFLAKIILFFAAPLLIVVGLIFGVSWLLNIDDLASCESPSREVSTCYPADAIVAISGGDTDARTSEAIRLYKQGWAKSLIFSGAAQDKNSPSNAQAMRLQALNAGIGANDIIIDEYAANTAGNAAGIAAITQHYNFKRIVLVTSPYHQRRANIEFSRSLGEGITIINHPTPKDKYWEPSSWWMNPYSWYLAVSEIVKLFYLNVTVTGQ